MQEVARAIAQDLHFDMAGVFDITFQENRVVSESRAGLAPRFGEPLSELCRAAHHAHATSAAAEGRFDDQRKADAPRYALRLARVGNRVFGARHRGNASTL